MNTYSDYKDDGTNILLDANENAYGPGLALNDDGKLSRASTNGTSSSIDVDLLGLNRYPDPYEHARPFNPIMSLTIYKQPPRTPQTTTLHPPQHAPPHL
jgi:hypothetical protein